MKQKLSRLAVLTSGGDSPGMNACIRAVVRTAAFHGIEVFGVRNGFRGLVQGDALPLHVGSVGNIIQRGGTILGTSRCPEFEKKSGRSKAFEFLKNLHVQALVCLGGDGTFRGASEFSKEFPIRVVGVPCTIDNDIFGTEMTIGFDSAVNTAVQAIDKIRDTADSHGRIFLIEVMGRNTGHLALETALAVGAEFVVIPELPFRLSDLAQKIQRGIDRGKTGSIVIVAEADQPARVMDIAKSLKKKMKRDIRAAILGHIQRGGSPTSFDRNLASRFGRYSVELLLAGRSRVMTSSMKGQMMHHDLSLVAKGERPTSLNDYQLIRILSI